MDQTGRSPHPDPASLRRFALGRLHTEAMHRIERHLRGCDLCLQVALDTPDDHLVGLLRRVASRPNAEPRGPVAANSVAASKLCGKDPS